MTVSEAIEQTMGQGAGFLQRGAVRYAQSLLAEGESVAAAVTAEISASVRTGAAVRREKFPGVAVLTERRAIAVCVLPGIRRAVLVDRGPCVESPSAIRYTAAFSDGTNSFSLSLNPEDGERFARCVAVLEGRGEAFDAAAAEPSGGIWNPVLIRNRNRARRTREEKARQAREARENRRPKPREEPDTVGGAADTADGPSGAAHGQEDAKATAARLAAELEAAREQGHVRDTDPKAVAARLAAELAAEEIETDRVNRGGEIKFDLSRRFDF